VCARVKGVRERGSWAALFSFGVQHLHEQCLRGSAAAAVLQVQAVFATGGYVMDVGQHGQQFSEFVLKKRNEHRYT